MENFSIIKLIELQMENYSPSEKKVAEFVLAYPNDVLNMTTKQLAEACESSEGTIIRFCQKAGINSFKGLKLEIAKVIRLSEPQTSVDTLLSFEDDTATVLEKVMRKNISALTNTSKLVQLEQIDAAVQAIDEADRVYVYGAGGSAVVAMDAEYKFLRINVPTFLSLDHHVQMMMMANITKNDVLFVVTTSGKTKEVIDLLNVAKEKGAKTICLTQHGKSPAQRLSDIVLTISEEEQNIRIGTMSARIAQLAIIDTLFIRLCIRKGLKVYERIIDTHQIVQKMKR
ncbi:MurR/RpiR family transcriptional regulator [Neobacillus sp. D3-1R]|uniref:MurR/RpiR family transcriptional regulator n=1 Tax=Neobacillus sp. D3-1R TaxID=3445778 RepID=UPI003F9F1D64